VLWDHDAYDTATDGNPRILGAHVRLFSVVLAFKALLSQENEPKTLSLSLLQLIINAAALSPKTLTTYIDPIPLRLIFVLINGFKNLATILFSRPIRKIFRRRQFQDPIPLRLISVRFSWPYVAYARAVRCHRSLRVQPGRRPGSGP
jgi:hypothetical protein